MEAHGDGVLAVLLGDFPGYGPVVGHRAGQLGTAGVGGLAIQHLGHSNRSVRGIHVLSAGAGDGRAGLIVGGNALGQLVRGHAVGGQVELDLFADDDLIYILVSH